MRAEERIILCVDDEENILNAIRRLLRREGYRVLTTSSTAEALNLLVLNPVTLVISDQRMPQMTGTEFLDKVKEMYPDVIRVILTGYTDVDSITGAVNRGLIYKFLLKPWNDEDLKLDIRQALEQYDLIQDNKTLHMKILEQNEALRLVNENLEDLIRERTEELEIKNHSLELAQAVLEDVPIPVVGISAEGFVALTNKSTLQLPGIGIRMRVGFDLGDCLPAELSDQIMQCMHAPNPVTFNGRRVGDAVYDLCVSPLSGRFGRRGLVLTLKPSA
jgi:FixJ family two-component response regulator